MLCGYNNRERYARFLSSLEERSLQHRPFEDRTKKLDEGAEVITAGFHGKFDYALRGRRRVICVVEVKADDLDEGMTQDLLG